jgi:DNA adenine methylase
MEFSTSDVRTIRPFVRWAGSKRSLLPTLLAVVPSFSRYVEPFAGSACLFFRLKPAHAILSDTNVDLINSYRMVREWPCEVAGRLRKMPESSSFYYHLRGRDQDAMSDIERAVRFIYLNRHCFNGVYRTNRKGQFNVPRGTKTGQMPSEADLIACSTCLKNTELSSGDFSVTIQMVRKGDFVYLDPPYVSKKRPTYGEYGYGSFGDQDLDRLCTALKSIDDARASFLLSYKYTPRLSKVFADWHTVRVLTRKHVSGFAQHRTCVTELLVSNRSFPKPWPTAK